MTHDILHCDFDFCPATNFCKRYQAHIEAVKEKLPYCSYLLIEEDSKPKILDLGSCPNFLPHEQCPT